MKITIYTIPPQVPDDALKEKCAVVIDVLRASSSMVTAIANGCREIFPQPGMEEAAQLRDRLEREEVLMGGEREGRKIAGYDLGNSPREYATDRVKDRSVIFTSTNGSRAIVKTRFCSLSLVASFLNVSATSEYIAANGKDIILICSGREAQFSLEDTVCAGMVVTKVLAYRNKPVALNDAARAAVMVFNHYSHSLLGMLQESDHGQYLMAIGFARDLEDCSQVDRYHQVLVFQDGRITGI